MSDYLHSSRFVDPAEPLSPPGNFEILLDAALEATYAQMQTEALASAGTLGAAYYNSIISQVSTNPQNDSNYALIPAIAYRMTGDVSYVAEVLERLSGWMLLTTFSLNSIREHGAEKVLILTWIWDALTTEQRDAYLAQLDDMFTSGYSASPASAPIRTSDSDQTVGTYFATAWYHLAFGPLHPQATAFFNHVQVGGLDATALDRTTLRNAIAYYVDQAEGGEWVEGSSYNLGTVRLLVIGAAGVKHITGIDYFPEITAWKLDAAKRYPHIISPDLVKSMQWGDVEEANIFEPWAHISTAMCFDDAVCRQLVYDLTDKYGMTGSTVDPIPLSFLMFNPYGTKTATSTLPLIFDAVDGMGVMTARTSWSTTVHTHMMTQHPAYMGWDHGVTYSGDIQCWRNMEWALRHPISYLGPATLGSGNNAMIHEGFGAPNELRAQDNKVYSGSGWVYSAGTVGGSVVNSTYYQPPAVFWHEWSRSFLWIQDTDADVVIVFDRTHAFDPQTLANFTRYTTANQNKIIAQPLRRWNWHAPIIPTIVSNTASWVYGTGTTKVTWLRSDITATVVDEDVEYASYSMNAAERDYHVKLVSSPDVAGFTTATHVLEFGNPAHFATSITEVDADDAMGVQIQRSGKFTIVALFNAIAGQTLLNHVSSPTRAWNPANPAKLLGARIRSTAVDYTPASGVHMFWPETSSGVLAEVIP